jgi:hypothetical protein
VRYAIFTPQFSAQLLWARTNRHNRPTSIPHLQSSQLRSIMSLHVDPSDMQVAVSRETNPACHDRPFNPEHSASEHFKTEHLTREYPFTVVRPYIWAGDRDPANREKQPFIFALDSDGNFLTRTYIQNGYTNRDHQYQVYMSIHFYRFDNPTVELIEYELSRIWGGEFDGGDERIMVSKDYPNPTHVDKLVEMFKMLKNGEAFSQAYFSSYGT